MPRRAAAAATLRRSCAPSLVECARVSNEEWQTHVTLPHPAFPLESRSGNTDTQFCVDAELGEAVLRWGCLSSPSQSWAIL